MPASNDVHRFQASLFPVNAYLVETADAVVAIDATLGASDGRAMAAQIKAIGKPLAGVIVTHSHPDHYGGLTTLLEESSAPIFSVAGVRDVIQRDDEGKERILRPMFGDEWPKRRTFPSRVVPDGERMSIGGAVFHVTDVGAGESPHDSWWVLEGDGQATAFVGDLAYSHMHAFLGDGYSQLWLKNLARARRELPGDVKLMIGHGEPTSGHSLLEWQADYIGRVLELLRKAVERDGLDGPAVTEAVTAGMREFLPTDDLLFLTRLSVEPLRRQLLSHTR